MTPQEAAALANNGSPQYENKEVHEWLKAASPQELHEFLYLAPLFFHHTCATLNYRLAEEQIRAAKIMERQTNKLIVLTWGLVGLTVALLFFTIFLYKDSHELTQREQQADRSATQKQ
ncbi:MAG: hypothetical protein NTY01_24840 [Verrucomicrobia bacterium]|nr:hypothetical protein [Verrucomicrobiota bacterium]